MRGILGMDSDIRNGFSDIKVTYDIDADASPDDIKALVAQSQKRSAVYDIITNPDQRERRGRLSQPGGCRIFGGSVRTTAVVIGAGQSGLAMSRCLADCSIDHVVLERNEVASSWRPSGGTRCGCSHPTGSAGCPATPTKATTPTAS